MLDTAHRTPEEATTTTTATTTATIATIAGVEVDVEVDEVAEEAFEVMPHRPSRKRSTCTIKNISTRATTPITRAAQPRRASGGGTILRTISSVSAARSSLSHSSRQCRRLAFL